MVVQETDGVKFPDIVDYEIGARCFSVRNETDDGHGEVVQMRALKKSKRSQKRRAVMMSLFRSDLVTEHLLLHPIVD